MPQYRRETLKNRKNLWDVIESVHAVKDLGTICVIDRTPREFGPDQQSALEALSRLVLAQLEFRRNLMLLKEALNDRTKEEHERQGELVRLQKTLLRVLGLRP